MMQTTNSTCAFKEGDVVQVTDIGQTYNLYRSYAAELELDNWAAKWLPVEDDTYIVIRDIGKTSCIIAIEDLDSGKQFLIGTSGVKHAEEV
jgi:hypothetical protein